MKAGLLSSVATGILAHDTAGVVVLPVSDAPRMPAQVDYAEADGLVLQLIAPASLECARNCQIHSLSCRGFQSLPSAPSPAWQTEARHHPAAVDMTPGRPNNAERHQP